MHLAVPAVVLALTWVVWSGSAKALLLSLGAVSVGLVLWLGQRMDLFRGRRTDWGLLLRFPPFVLWLLREVFISSFHVARLVLDPRVSIDPAVVRIEALPRTRAGLSTLGNSITRTPGTVTLDVYKGQLLVHALRRVDAEALLEGEMNRRVAALLPGPDRDQSQDQSQDQRPASDEPPRSER